MSQDYLRKPYALLYRHTATQEWMLHWCYAEPPDPITTPLTHLLHAMLLRRSLSGEWDGIAFVNMETYETHQLLN